ncbi:MAG TPA: tetratricopeptide repeat protein [Polyangium sp.]|nr:tetratricopeptide repeat protein [Polyangium sp.]
MRPLHLLGLPAAEYRFYAPDGAPLVLPGAIPTGDHEIILAFYHQVLTERLLPRVEVDWYTKLLAPSQRYLEYLLGHLGSSGVFLVVKVREQGVDLRNIIEHPVIHAFEHVAISNVHPGGGEPLRTLLALTRDVRDRAEELYNEHAERLGLRLDGWQMVADFVQSLQNPIDVLETVNALMEIQLETNAPEDQRKRILQRMLIRLLEWRPAGELCALMWLATKGFDMAQTKLGEEASGLLAGLQAQGLLRDAKLQQWAKYLEHHVLWEGMFAAEGRLPTEAQLTEKWAKRVRAAIRQTGRRALFEAKAEKHKHAILHELLGAFQDDNEGRSARARERFDAAERIIQVGVFGADVYAYASYVRGILELDEGALTRAEESLRDALQYAERGNIEFIIRGRMAEVLGLALHRQGRNAEAETTLRAALRLKVEHGDFAISRAITMGLLGRTLQGQRKYVEAETIFRDLLRLQAEANETATTRGITMHSLGLALYNQGKFAEAETALRESLRLGKEGGDTSESLATTQELLDEVLEAQRKAAEPS